MDFPQTTLPVLLLILLVGLLIPELLKKFRLPFVTLIILTGSVLGPYGLDYVQFNDTIAFLGFLGMTFLMFMAGLETDTSRLADNKYKILTMGIMNGLIPFTVGMIIAASFGYSLMTSLLVGIVFISSSIALIIPSLSRREMDSDDKQLILTAVMITDVISLIALGLVFQSQARITELSLPLYYIILVGSIFLLFYFIPRLSKFAFSKQFTKDKGYERPLRLVIIILVGTLIFFSLLGVHPILAAFLVGLALSRAAAKDKNKIIDTKLHTMGYGLFIPVFFFIVGMEMDLTLFSQFDISNVLMIALILGLIGSKLFSGYLAGRLVNLKKKTALLFGSVSVSQLTTTLALVYAASSLDLLDTALTTSIVLLSIVTTIVGPILSAAIQDRVD